VRTRIVRMFSQSKAREVYVVQQWMTKEKITRLKEIRREDNLSPPNPNECWESLVEFNLDEYDKAADHAMNLSWEKKGPKEVAVFENGTQVPSPFSAAADPLP
jgi:hypothetical protein